MKFIPGWAALCGMICVILLIIVSHNYNEDHNKDLENRLYHLAEQSFAEGQAFAINGDIRIRKINDSTYIWTKSPWNNGRKPQEQTIIIKAEEK